MRVPRFVFATLAMLQVSAVELDVVSVRPVKSPDPLAWAIPQLLPGRLVVRNVTVPALPLAPTGFRPCLASR